MSFEIFRVFREGSWAPGAGRRRYLVYLNNRAAGKGSVKTIDLRDQKTAP
jgi:hypothetical protein